ncbi:MAG: hypothetical protein R2932_44830 [Caldilineaceae bacterium]
MIDASATYTSLHPGTYAPSRARWGQQRQLVSCRNYLDGAGFARWWQTIWFRFLAIGLVMGGV